MSENENVSTADVERPNWGRWGPTDELGSANLLDEGVALRGAGAVRTGKVYSLSLPVQRTGVPHAFYRPPTQRYTSLNQTDHQFRDSIGAPDSSAWNEDVLVTNTHSQTHIDALCHVTDNGVMYNGFPGAEVSAFDGARRLGVQNIPPIVTRGILLDIARNQGVDRLAPGHIITEDELRSAIDAAQVDIQPGDAVLFRTGWLEAFRYFATTMDDPQPGIGSAAAKYLAERDVVAIGGDNTSLEAYPFENGRFLGVHQDLLVGYGTYIVEHLSLADLAKDGHHSFLFVVAPLRITGATGSPVNVVAVA